MVTLDSRGQELKVGHYVRVSDHGWRGRIEAISKDAKGTILKVIDYMKGSEEIGYHFGARTRYTRPALCVRIRGGKQRNIETKMAKRNKEGHDMQQEQEVTSEAMPETTKTKKERKAKEPKEVPVYTGPMEVLCLCGCGEMIPVKIGKGKALKSQSAFRPGHDARLSSVFRKIMAGTATDEERARVTKEVVDHPAVRNSHYFMGIIANDPEAFKAMLKD